MDQRLHKRDRLSNRSDYTRCYQHGERLRSRFFTVYAYQRGNGMPRLGVAVGKAVGKSVVRNRVKRRLRELFRRHKASVPGGYDLFVRALPAGAAAGFPELAAAWGEIIASLAAAAAIEDVQGVVRPPRQPRATHLMGSSMNPPRSEPGWEL